MNQITTCSTNGHTEIDNPQGDNVRSDTFEEEIRNNKLAVGNPDQNLDVDSEQLIPPVVNKQNDQQNKKNITSNSPKNLSPALGKKGYKKKANISGPMLIKCPNKGELRNRHRDLSQDSRHKLGVPATVSRNSPLATTVQEEGNLDRILTDSQTKTDSGSSSEVTIQLLNAQVQSLNEELKNLIQECVDKDEMVISLKQQLKDTEVDKTKLQSKVSSKDRLIDKLQKSLVESNEKCDGIKKELCLINKEYLELKSSIVNKEHELKQIKSKVRARDEIVVKREETTNRETEALKQKTTLVKQLRKDVDILKQSQRQAAIVKSNLEAKINRALEDNERLKNEARQAKHSSRGTSDHQQRRLDELGENNRRLERQNSELHESIKKQMKLILNLKRQMMHIEVAKAIKFTEKEFMKAIEKEI